MKLHISTSGGREPAVVVTVERADLNKLADAIKEPALPATGFAAHGSYDTLKFRVVADITPLIKKEEKKIKWMILPSIILFWSVITCVLYLAYLGLKTLL